MRADTGG